jgi:hypothetical protein
MIDNKLKGLLRITIIVKIFFFLIIILAYFVLPFNIGNYHTNFVYPQNEPVNIFSVFKTWDGQHYLFLAEKGYPSEVTTSTAFYPLYPFIIRVFGFIFSGNTLVAGLFISNLCSILAIVYFYLLVKKFFFQLHH